MSEMPNELTEAILRAAIAVHRELGPGLLESAYEACRVYELGVQRRLACAPGCTRAVVSKPGNSSIVTR
jgi:GxxExxY protein